MRERSGSREGSTQRSSGAAYATELADQQKKTSPHLRTVEYVESGGTPARKGKDEAMITAQDLYTAREHTAAIDGNELHELFAAVCGGPSPAGRTEIDTAALADYAAGQRSLYAAHRASGGIGGEYLLSVADFAASFAR